MAAVVRAHCHGRSSSYWAALVQSNSMDKSSGNFIKKLSIGKSVVPKIQPINGRIFEEITRRAFPERLV